MNTYTFSFCDGAIEHAVQARNETSARNKLGKLFKRGTSLALLYALGRYTLTCKE